MQQHPIPQQISSYEFRLVGYMTLKQFAKLAGGVILGFLLYSSNLPFYFRWPLVIASVSFGAASAFLPINDRPLEVWLFNFIKRIYSPTIYIWKKQHGVVRVASLFTPQPVSTGQVKKVRTAHKIPQYEEFVSSMPAPLAAAPVAKEEVVPQPTPETGADSISEATAKIEEILREKKPMAKFSAPVFEKNPMPALPTTANIVCGLLVDDLGRILEGVIVEIQDIQGNPIRAMRTNRLGQFQTATPLANGSYLIVAEKEPYAFDIIKIEAKGEIIAPIKIKAKGEAQS